MYIRTRRGAVQITDKRGADPLLLESRGLHWKANIRRAVSGGNSMQVTLYNLLPERNDLWHKGLRIEVFAGYSRDVYGVVGKGHVSTWDHVLENAGTDKGTHLVCTQDGDGALAGALFDDPTTGAAVVTHGTSLTAAVTGLLRRIDYAVRNPEIMGGHVIKRSIPVSKLGERSLANQLLRQFGFSFDVEGSEYILYKGVSSGNAIWHLTEDTGMISIPRPTNYGMEVQSTVIPNVLLGDTVYVNQSPAHYVRALTHNLSLEGDHWHTKLEIEDPTLVQNDQTA